MHSQTFRQQEFQMKGKTSANILHMLEKQMKKEVIDRNWRITLGNGKKTGSTVVVFSQGIAVWPGGQHLQFGDGASDSLGSGHLFVFGLSQSNEKKNP